MSAIGPCVSRLGSTALVIVGRDDGDALVVVAFFGSIGAVPLPESRIVVDMVDHNARSRDILVPTFLLTVLDEIVLIATAGVGHLVDFATLGCSLQVLDAAGKSFREVNGVNPSADHLLISGVASRTIFVAIVAARAHEVPGTHAIPGVAGARVAAGVIHVGITQAVGELVADGADAHIAVGTAQLVGAGVDADILVAILHRRSELPLVGPYGIGAATGSLATAGIDDIDFLDKAVAIPVVWREIEAIGISLVAGIKYHTAGVLVVATDIAAIRNLRAEGIGTYHVEGDVEHTTALGAEVVCHTAYKLTFFETFFIGHAVVVSLGIVHRESDVRELGEDNEATLLAGEVDTLCHLLSPRLALLALTAGRLHLAAHDAGVELQLLHVCHTQHIVAFKGVTGAVLGFPVTHKLVATQLYANSLAIGGLEDAPHAWVGGDGMDCYCSCQQQQCSKESFHHDLNYFI